MNFDGVSTGPLCQINIAGAATRVVSPNPAAAVTVNATNVALVTNQAAATATAAVAVAVAVAVAAAVAVTLVATLPTVFSIKNLPLAVKTRHKNHMDPTFLMTSNVMQPFLTTI